MAVKAAKQPSEKKTTGAKPAMEKKKSPKGAKERWEQELDQFIHLLIVSVLKTCSDEEHPVSAAFIEEELEKRFGLGLGANSPDSVIRRLNQKLDNLCDLGNAVDKPTASRWPEGATVDIYRGLGGKVIRSEKMDGKKTLYYFEPILSESDVAYINSALESTHYLSEEEKAYLIARESAVCGYWGYPKSAGKSGKQPDFSDLWDNLLKKNLPGLPKAMGKDLILKKSDSQGKLPTEDSSMLKKLMILHKAIRKRKQIDVVYGEYAAGEKDRLSFAEKHTGKVYHLNPYAVISQNGMAYMIVTHKGHTNPTHFRIDRIMELKLSGNAREEVPQELEDFFEHKGNRRGSFQPEKYVSVYPLMMYRGDKKYEDCEFLCKASAVSVAVDCFGTKAIRIKKDSDEEVRIRVRASYDNVKYFCIQQCQIITPLSPPELVKEVEETLESAAKRICEKNGKKK